MLIKKDKLTKLNEKLMNENVDYRKNQLENKIKTKSMNLFWNSSEKGTYRCEKINKKEKIRK